MHPTPSLKQTFGFWTGWFLVVACMIGSGILTTSGPIIKNTGSYSALLGLWVAGGFIALCGALTLGELASGLPRVGGDYAFIREAFGPMFGFVYGWAMVLLGFAGPVALLAYTTALYLQPASITLFASTSLAAYVAGKSFLLAVSSVLIIVFTFLHCLGQRESSRVQGITTLFKIFVLLALIAIAFFSPKSQWGNLLVPHIAGSCTLPALSSALILVMYAYTGWNAAAYLSGEIRESSKIVPWCITFGTLAVTLIYGLVNIAFGLALSPAQVLALSPDETSRIADSAANALLGNDWGRIFSFLVSLGVFASLSAYILTGPRVVFSMAHDGLLPKWIGKIDPKAEVPSRATVFQGVLSLILLWSGTFQELLDFTGYGLAVLGILVVAPIFAMRKRASFNPLFRVPFYPWTPGIFLLLSVAMLIGGAMDNLKLAVLSTLSIGIGFPLYFGWKRFSKTPIR